MISDFKQSKMQLLRSMDTYYQGCPYDCSEQQKQMDIWYAELSDRTCYEKKALTYRGAAELCDVKLFDESPFYHEIISGRERNTSQNGFPPGPGLEGWYMRKQMALLESFQSFMSAYEREDLVWGSVFSDHAHHTAGYEKLFQIGFRGIEAEAASALLHCNDSDSVGFYNSVLTACKAVKTLGEKYSAAASARLSTGTVAAEYCGNLEWIAKTAYRVPYEAPQTFYEALCTILFTKELVIHVEGVAVAILGHLDRILLPFYEKDVKEGRLHYESAKNLMAHFLVHTDGRWELNNHSFASTNCSLVIGGCDADGNIVFNDITRMILEAYEENGFVNPKIQVRLTTNHPEELLTRCSKMICNGQNVFSFLNDEVIIPAHVKMGKELQDARQYSAGGCQEPILDNCEFNSRAFIYISLPQMLNTMLDHVLQARIPDSLPVPEYDSFEALYQDYIHRLSNLYQKIVDQLNACEKDIPEFCPMPLLSSTVTGCMEKGRDMTKRGAKYNAISMPFVGIGTAIDALLAIREVVFEKKLLSLSQLRELLADNFRSDPLTRAYLVNKCPKYGDDSDAVNQFAARFFRDVAALARGYQSPLGAVYEPSLFVFYLFDWMKEHVGATADGRYAGVSLSRGINPPDFSAKSQIPHLLHTVSDIDLTDYPGAAVLYLEMPIGNEPSAAEHLCWTVRGFLQAGGSALDLQVLDPAILKKARKNPDQYSNLVVRVCGFSAYYTSLEENIQDEILERVFVHG